jgi:Holliday junction resolvase
MNPEDLSKLAFRLYPHIAKADPGKVEVDSLADRIKDIQRGLMPEDEFAATVCWLGNCAGIHRIDQTPMPLLEMPEKMRAPDFLAFPLFEGKIVPVLIEVKSRHVTQLDWSEPYLASLKRFAAHLNLPLLVAWKCGDLWTLVDVAHFEENVSAFRLTLERALREDLLCLLFRNLRIQMNPDLQLRLDFRILDEVETRPDGLMPEGTYHMQVTGAGFYCDGNEVKGYASEHFWLFLTTPDETEFERIGDRECRQIYRPRQEHGFTLSNVLVGQLSWGDSDEPLDWHTVLTKPLPSSGRQFSDSLQKAIENGFVRYVLDVIPNTWPAFLPARSPKHSATDITKE